MGWKSTKTITRQNAEEAYCTLKFEQIKLKLKLKLKSEAVLLNDTELEDIIEELAGGDKHSYNYMISENATDFFIN